jgi:hypothetical protein
VEKQGGPDESGNQRRGHITALCVSFIEKLQRKANANSPDQNEQNANAALVIITRRLVNATRVIAVVGILAFGAAVLQWCALDNTDKATRIAADAAKKSADALVTIESPYIFTDVPQLGDSAISGITQINFTLTNYGRTPAILRLYVAQTYSKEVKLGDRDPWTGWEVLRQGEGHKGKLVQTGGRLVKKETTTAEDRDANKTPLCWLEVFYLDMFNNMHTADFTFFYMNDGSRHKFVAIGGEKYNYRHIEKMSKGEWQPKVRQPPMD